MKTMKEHDISIHGVMLHTKYEYTPPDYGVRYHPDGSGTPPTAAELNIESIFIEDVDVTDLILDNTALLELVETSIFDYEDDADSEDFSVDWED